MSGLQALLKELVSINTNSTKRLNYERITNLITKKAREYDLNTSKTVVNGIPHLKITLPETSGERVIFLTHYDVVPAGEGWSTPPFKPVVKNGERGEQLFGRGASDDKSCIAASLIAFKEIVEENLPSNIDPVLIVAGGEETGEGAPFFRKVKGDFGIVLDCGPEGLSRGASGVVRAHVTVQGEQSHSAYPYKGKNAIYQANSLIELIKNWGASLEESKFSKYNAPVHYEKLPARMNITMAKGGVAGNIIPGEFNFTVDRRTIPEEDITVVADQLKDKIEVRAKELEVEVNVETDPLMEGWATEDEQIVERTASLLEEILGEKPKKFVELGGTDGAWLIERMPVIQFGALRSDNRIHGKNEFVWMEDVRLTKKFVKKIITEF